MDDATQTRMATALKSTDAVAALSEVVRQMKTEGKGQQEIYALFKEFLQAAQGSVTEREDDAIRDVMDFIVGWCSPHQRLFDTYLKT